MDFDNVQTTFEGWSFAPGFPTKRATELSNWRSFAAIVEEIVKGEVHCAAWESFEGNRLHGCWRIAFEVRVGHAGICDAFYNAAAGYRAQFARGIEHGVAGNHWLLNRPLKYQSTAAAADTRIWAGIEAERTNDARN